MEKHTQHWLTHSGLTFTAFSSDTAEPTIPAYLAHLGKHTTLGHSFSPDEYWSMSTWLQRQEQWIQLGLKGLNTLTRTAVISIMGNLGSALPFKKHCIFTANSMTECKPVKMTKYINLTTREIVTNTRLWEKGNSTKSCPWPKTNHGVVANCL